MDNIRYLFQPINFFWSRCQISFIWIFAFNLCFILILGGGIFWRFFRDDPIVLLHVLHNRIFVRKSYCFLLRICNQELRLWKSSIFQKMKFHFYLSSPKQFVEVKQNKKSPKKFFFRKQSALGNSESSLFLFSYCKNLRRVGDSITKLTHYVCRLKMRLLWDVWK